MEFLSVLYESTILSGTICGRSQLAWHPAKRASLSNSDDEIAETVDLAFVVREEQRGCIDLLDNGRTGDSVAWFQLLSLENGARVTRPIQIDIPRSSRGSSGAGFDRFFLYRDLLNRANRGQSQIDELNRLLLPCESILLLVRGVKRCCSF